MLNGNPTGITIRSDDVVFVSKSLPYMVMRIDAASGSATPVAGSYYSYGYGEGGPATEAQIIEPRGITFDSEGNLYLADFHRIVRVDVRTGTIHTVKDDIYNHGKIEMDNDENRLLVVDFPHIREVDLETRAVTTIAGIDEWGFSGDDGPAILARMNGPGGVAIDSDGNIFIADTYNERVRRVDAVTGIITTVAGTGIYGYSGDNIPAVSAQLCTPRDVAVDDDGNVYIADFGNDRIRRVDMASGIITTVAGNGVQGTSGYGGPATSAQLNRPRAITFDRDGNMYIAQGLYVGHHILRIEAATGIIQKVAGTRLPDFTGDGGPALHARIAYPGDVAVDSGGNVFFTDLLNDRVRAVRCPSSAFVSPTFVPAGLAYDGIHLYIAAAMEGGNKVYKTVVNTGEVVGSFLTPANNLNGITYAGSGRLFMTDIGTPGAGRVYELSTSGTVLNSVSIPFRGGAITFDGTNFFISDVDASTVRVIDRSGSTIRSFDSRLRIAGMTYDASSDHLWVINIFDKKISEITKYGRKVRSFEGPRTPGVKGIGGVTKIGSRLYIAEVSDVDPVDVDYIGGIIYMLDLKSDSPTTTATLTPPANSEGWNNTVVTVELSACDEDGSPCVEEIHYRVDSGSDIVVRGSHASVEVMNEGTTTIYYYAIDNQGMVESENTVDIRLDLTPPVVDFGGTCPPNVELGGAVNISVTVSDALSGVASQSVPNGDHSLEISAMGANTFTVTAQDVAGNVSTKVCSYQVTYNFSGGGGFGPPMQNPPTVNTRNAGSVAPLTWQIADGSGGFISDLGIVLSIQYQQVDCMDYGIALGPRLDAVSPGGSGLHFNTATNEFNFNWQTDSSMAGNCYVLILTLDDGSENKLWFQFT